MLRLNYKVDLEQRSLTTIIPTALSGIRKTYAELLALEFGQCSYLHYGMTADRQAQEDFPSQQQKFAEKLFRLATEGIDASLNVLLAGPSLTHAANELAVKGNNVTLLNNLLGPGYCSENSGVRILDQSLDSFSSDHKFDLLIVEGTYHYLQQLPLLSRARELLGDSGRLLVFGEYLDDDSKMERSSLPNLSSMRQLSERLSYNILDELNFTADAKESIEQLSAIAIKQKSNLRSPDEFEILQSELEKIQSEIASKRRCFKIFHLQKKEKPEGEYALAEYGAIDSFDPEEISNLFEKSFNTQFNADVWQWKYELGEGKCVVARESKDGNIVSHYGGAPRQIQYFGQPNTAIQVCDVMVLPEIRRQYGKSSLFFKSAATFLEREIGNTVNHLLGFGFPNQKAMNIALRLELYEKTDDFVELVFPQSSDADVTGKQLISIDISKQHQQENIDGLWNEMRQNLSEGIVGDRHWRYIKYRYFDHPFAQANLFRCVFLTDESAKPKAAVFLKEHEQRLLIMDLICPVANMKDVIIDLNQLLEESELKMWITMAWVDKLRTDGAIENYLGIEIPCNFWNPGPSSKGLYGAWWLTAGDMDFM
ncbi:MAG: GNAT family N-acetyltransferase [Pseudomonadales bacterium]|nr:GNAT family N-acetyltransferase [Pseudomonadales bacterium]